MMLFKCWTQYVSKFGKLRGLEKVSLHSNPKERQCQRMLKLLYNVTTIPLISHASKVILKILQARLQQYMNQELSDVKAGFRKGRRTKDQIANIHWIIEKAGNSRKTSISVSMTMLKSLTVWITTNLKILKIMGILDHFTCLLRNLYVVKKQS